MPLKRLFVSRFAFDMAVNAEKATGARCKAAEDRADRAEAEVARVRTESMRQINHAYELSAKSIEQAQLAIAESRAAMREVVDVHKTMYGPFTEQEVTAPTSIRENDRLVAQSRRDAAAGKSR
jgi:hypothetical protein